jgi:hypothetical protein
MRRFILSFSAVVLFDCGAAVQNQSIDQTANEGEVQQGNNEVEPVGSRLPPVQRTLDVFVPCETDMACTMQEEAIRMVLGQRGEQCFEGLGPGLYSFHLRLSRDVQLSPFRDFPQESLLCLRGYIQHMGQLGEELSIDFILRYTPPEQSQIAPSE